MLQECIEYQYDGESILHVDHTNALFNCCPGEIFADTAFSPGLIAITEWEAEAGCRCGCEYDLEYQFTNIPPGVYTIRISTDREVTFEYTIDLNNSNSGSKCWNR